MSTYEHLPTPPPTSADLNAGDPFDAVEVRVVPGNDAVVVVTDDAQIGPNTILVD